VFVNQPVPRFVISVVFRFSVNILRVFFAPRQNRNRADPIQASIKNENPRILHSRLLKRRLKMCPEQFQSTLARTEGPVNFGSETGM
jgi:hypothetical protein